MYKHEKNIFFLGKLNSPYLILEESSLLVVPSIADSFPNTILEALNLNIPVIGNSSGGIPEVLKYNELLFESSSTSLKEKIEFLLITENFINISNLCKRRAKELEFDWVKKMLEMVVY